MVDIMVATIEDVIDLQNRLRKQDKDEVKALISVYSKKALEMCFRESDEVYSAKQDNNVICMFGISKNSEGNGVPWLLGSDLVSDIPITFIRESRKYVREFLNEYGYLENYVDVRNELSIQWLKWLGFKIEEPKPYGVEKRLFSRFTLGGVNKCV